MSPEANESPAIFITNYRCARPDTVAKARLQGVVPGAGLRYFDGGHFVLDDNADAIAAAILEKFSR